MDEYTRCTLCPRACGINRYVNNGYCGEKSLLHVARAALHFWEEPCISGKSGSGAVFFSGCNMGCIFCQNRKISRGQTGLYIEKERLVEIFFELKEQGANNINLVTGDMFIPSIRDAISSARDQGFDLPFLFNTSSYLSVDAVKSLEGLIDIYLPDFKYIRDADSVRYSSAPGYADSAKAAIDEMVRQRPECVFIESGRASEPGSSCDNVAVQTDQFCGGRADACSSEALTVGQSDDTDSCNLPLISRGVIVRHLLLPGMLIQAKAIVHYLHERYGDNIYLSLMSQYTPNGELSAFPEIDRKVTHREYRSLVSYAQNLGITKAFVQEGDVATESFIPDFDCTGVPLR